MSHSVNESIADNYLQRNTTRKIQTSIFQKSNKYFRKHIADFKFNIMKIYFESNKTLKILRKGSRKPFKAIYSFDKYTLKGKKRYNKNNALRKRN